MRFFKALTVGVLTLAIWSAPVLAQEVDPDPETEAPLPDDPQGDTEIPEDDAEVTTLNETQDAKAEKLAEASGVSVEQIKAMRAGTTVEAPEGEQPAEEAPKGRGWGVIAKWLGLSPSTVGNSKKNLDDAEEPETEGDEELPDPPELDEDAAAALGAAERKSLTKKEQQQERRETKLAAAAEKKSSARGKDKSTRAKEKKNTRERATKDKPGKRNNSGKNK